MRKKKKARNKRSHVKHKQFDDLSISALENHKRTGGVLTPPLATISTISISWRDEGMLDVLWAALLRANLEQEECLKHFRIFVGNAREKVKDHQKTFMTHSVIATFSDETFDIWVQTLIADARVKELLRPLLFFDCLPDRKHWLRHLDAPDPKEHSEYLMRAITECIDHQSQAATDIRWLKITYFAIVCERLRLPEEKVEEIRLYPNRGDQRSVRPSIRAMEMSLRGIHKGIRGEVPPEIKDFMPPDWYKDFWKECFEKTPCIPLERKIPEIQRHTHYLDQFYEIYKNLAGHFSGTIEHTSIDSRHDSSFGLVFYSLVLGMEVARSRLDSTAGGRLILRTVVETFIALKFLAHKDDAALWLQHRNYGVGQTKLAFLKNLREESIPGFINLEELHMYSNEDFWQEFTDVNLKSWASLNLRQMAEEAGVKDVYDKHYDWSSGFVHGHWGVIRDTTFSICLNPLHRFHRIPDIPRLEMPSVITDIAKIINVMLDIVNTLYPSFKPRIKHPVEGEEKQAEEEKEE